MSIQSGGSTVPPDLVLDALGRHELTPISFIATSTGPSAVTYELITNLDGTSTTDRGDVVLSPTGTLFSGAVMVGNTPVRLPSCGPLVMTFSAEYPPSPVSGQQAHIGFFASADLYFMGYRPSLAAGFLGFAIVKGVQTVLVLDITTPAAGVETATVTLNGLAVTVDLTGGDGLHTANELAYSPKWTSVGWAANQINGSTVRFVSLAAGVTSGVFSFSSSTAAATFAAPEVVGAASTSLQTVLTAPPRYAGWDPDERNQYAIALYEGGPLSFYVRDRAAIWHQLGSIAFDGTVGAIADAPLIKASAVAVNVGGGSGALRTHRPSFFCLGPYPPYATTLPHDFDLTFTAGNGIESVVLAIGVRYLSSIGRFTLWHAALTRIAGTNLSTANKELHWRVYTGDQISLSALDLNFVEEPGTNGLRIARPSSAVVTFAADGVDPRLSGVEVASAHFDRPVLPDLGQLFKVATALLAQDSVIAITVEGEGGTVPGTLVVEVEEQV